MTRNERLAWFAACSFVILFGLGEFASWVLEAWTGQSWWAIDLRLVTDAGDRLRSGSSPYADPRFLYPPVTAALAQGVGTVGFDALAIAYACLKIVLGVACAAYFLRDLPRGWLALAAATVVCSLPFLHDVMLGNANVLLVAAVVPAFFASPRARSGVPLGVLAALFAKPLLVPVLLFLAVRRPRVAVGTVAVAGLTTLAGAAMAGPERYVDWARALTSGTRFAAPFEGNHGVSALLPEAWLPVAVVTATALVAIVLLRGTATGRVWALASGILIAPYAGTYAALPLALAIPSLSQAMPRLALALVATSPISTTHPLPFLAAAVLIASLGMRDHRESFERAEATMPVSPVPS